jgi:hypothetical protein
LILPQTPTPLTKCSVEGDRKQQGASKPATPFLEKQRRNPNLLTQAHYTKIDLDSCCCVHGSFYDDAGRKT